MATAVVIGPGGATLVDLGPAEEAQIAADQADIAQANARNAARGSARRAVVPDAPLRAKLRAGAPLTVADMAAILRWLSLNLDPTIAD